jgi:hypothetical protein
MLMEKMNAKKRMARKILKMKKKKKAVKIKEFLKTVI